MVRKRAWMMLTCAVALAALTARAEVTEEWGVDRRGDDYRNFRANDLAQCKAACEQESLCRAYTFTVGENVCYLKRGYGDSERRGGRVSGVKTSAAPSPPPVAAPAAPPAGPLSEEWGYDRPGNDYRDFQTPTLAACKSACRDEVKCRAYAFNHRSGTCYLKHGASEHQANHLYASGAKDPGNRPPAATEPTTEQGFDYAGNDYNSFKAQRPEDCRNACQQEEHCRAYSFNLRSGDCYLKEATGDRQRSANFIAGTKDRRQASPPPPPPRLAVGEVTEEWGYDYRGHDYRSFRSPDLGTCKAACRQENRCDAYTLNQRTNTCFLKDVAGPREANRDTVTGLKVRR
jgi:PAN domain